MADVSGHSHAPRAGSPHRKVGPTERYAANPREPPRLENQPVRDQYSERITHPSGNRAERHVVRALGIRRWVVPDREPALSVGCSARVVGYPSVQENVGQSAMPYAFSLSSMGRKLALAIGGLLSLPVVGLALMALVTSLSSVSTGEDDAHMVDLALLSVQVADVQPITTDPDQFLGVPHSRPDFDTSALGPDLTFRQDPDDLRALNPAQARRAVYLGHDQAGDPYYIWYVGSPNLRQRIGQIFADFGSVGRFGSSYGALVTGDGLLRFFYDTHGERISESGLTYASLSSGSGQPTVAVMEWHALPAEVAAVVFNLNGDVLGWQSPVSGTAAIQVIAENAAPFGFQPEMIALTADGEVWLRYPLESR